ncbi:hypothetical protein L596_005387 [Steinernema carpocapsae]|uniref:G-protein coupled receptors family 1 profile domain-containing protein n=1 Tax=Steinernema carpocapsae TaxID=34508 RepID=A0A4U8UYV1_STECR|nr:hypothetical protein L596_005387 [Steinernema carpocapsae]
MVPDVLYELLPIAGFALTASSLFVMVAMQKDKKGSFLYLYGLALIDMISGLAMLYAGFYGVLVTTYEDSSKMITPYDCITRAIHISLWCWMDYANAVVVAILCLDRLVSVVCGTEHDKWSKMYCRFPVFVVLFFCSAFSLAPVWKLSYETYQNASVKVSSFCYIHEIVDQQFYKIHTEMRLWTPIGGVAFLAIVFCLYVAMKSCKRLSYGWTEEPKQAQTMYLCIFMRCALTSLSVHLPMMAITNMTQNEDAKHTREFLLRLSQAILVGILQPGVYLIVSPSFFTSARIIFNRYSYNTKRTWQSSNDPPDEKHDDGDEPNFGSWYSTTGNITGDAGVPLDADIERSVSFYAERKAPGSNNYM